MRKSIAYYVQKEIDEYYMERCIHCGDEDCPGGSSTVESCMRLNRGPHGYIDLEKCPSKHIRIDDLPLGPSSIGQPFSIIFWDLDGLEAVKNLAGAYKFSMQPVYEWR
jgi:hypothetical protein